MALKNIDFGYASAEAESSRAPQLLLDGYFDASSAAEKAENGHEFLFLGYKGSGKTAISRRIELKSQNKHDRFYSGLDLGDFPFTPFSKIIKGDMEPESKYPLAWSWLLHIAILNSLSKDNGGIHPHPHLFSEAVNALRDVGLLDSLKLANIVKSSSKNGFQIKIPKILEFTKEKNSGHIEQSISFYTSSFQKIVEEFETSSKHIIVIDGLDDIITKRSAQFTALGGLLFEIAKLNDAFKKRNQPIKIVCLCRTDIFEKISNPNKNKIRQDYSVNLDWFHDPAKPGKSLLIEAANKRASLSLKAEIDIFSSYFPNKIREMKPEEYLLGFTRHTPRDFFQLLNKIKAICPDSSKVEYADIGSAVRIYSQDYFLPEIRDELDGYYSSDVIDSVIRSIESISRVEFSYENFKMSAIDQGIDAKEIDGMLNRLYDCSAITTVRRSNNQRIFSSKYRNRNSSYRSMETIVVHRGLQKALNLS